MILENNKWNKLALIIIVNKSLLKKLMFKLIQAECYLILHALTRENSGGLQSWQQILFYFYA